MKIIESPREGMQGLARLIPTDVKVKYINSVLKVGFDTVELGSIVSRKLIPQMADSLDVLDRIDCSGTRSNRMMLVVNKKGAEIIAGAESVTHISYPFSISPTFLHLNLNTTTEGSFGTVQEIAEICDKNKKEMVIYISMAFGNPYEDAWSMDLLLHWIGELQRIGVKTIPLSNVAIEIGKEQVSRMFNAVIPEFPDIEFGLHLHTTNKDWYDSVNAAWLAGCRRFDSVINGWGGCPMSGKEMLGNLDTANLVSYLDKNQVPSEIDREAFTRALTQASYTFIP
jgi:hydroxymethylglutaryl-CoA lyase